MSLDLPHWIDEFGASKKHVFLGQPLGHWAQDSLSGGWISGLILKQGKNIILTPSTKTSPPPKRFLGPKIGF